jgi:ribonuclease P protein component
MLSRGQRLKNRGLFTYTMQRGQRLFACSYFMVIGQRHWQSHFIPPPGLTSVKVGFVVSKKVHKRAVVRNRLRRQLKALWYAVLAAQGDVFRPWSSIVVIVRSDAVGQPFSTFSRSLSKGVAQLPSREPISLLDSHA